MITKGRGAALATGLALALSAAGCGGVARAPGSAVEVEPLDRRQVIAPPRAGERGDRQLAGDAVIPAMLARVRAARGLPLLHPVASAVVDRDELLAKLRVEVERDVPLDYVRDQGEALAAFELVPPDYDVVAGVYSMLQGSVAGFYDPATGTMVLADDLGDDAASETLAHELTHALQDQSYALGKRLAWKAGESDRIAAAHALAEGDATSAMLDVAVGSAFKVPEASLRRLLAAASALSPANAGIPRFLQDSLSTPYADGFAFVQRLRARGGWPAVDATWRAPPETTEQLLHPEKLAAREPAIPVPVPPLDGLGADFHPLVDDAMGEEGLRVVLEQWTQREAAERAAAGWGGDRFVVASSGGGAASAPRGLAAAWHLVFDTDRDGAELAAVLDHRFGPSCVTRAKLGPLAWRRRGREVVLAAGPYERAGAVARGTGSCADALRWIDTVLAGSAGRSRPRA